MNSTQTNGKKQPTAAQMRYRQQLGARVGGAAGAPQMTRDQRMVNRLFVMEQMAAGSGVPGPFSQGLAPTGPAGSNLLSDLQARIGAQSTPAGCSPAGCDSPIDQRVYGSVAAAGGGTVLAKPASVGVDDSTWNAIIAAIKTINYCPSPRRVGWQPDSITFEQDAVADGNDADVTLDLSMAFCSEALVGAAGTSNDARFDITSVQISGADEDQVTDGPWISLLYVPGAPCCLCAREWPVVEPGGTVEMIATNKSGDPADFWVQVFGHKLFC